MRIRTADHMLSATVARRGLAVAVAVLLGVLVFGGGSALAVTPGPALRVDSFAMPSNFSTADNRANCPGGGVGELPICDGYEVTVTNVGSLPTSGTPIVVTDTLPVGLTVKQIRFFWSGEATDLGREGFCNSAAVRCGFPEVLGPDATLTMFVEVTVEPAAVGVLMSTAGVSGGGAAETSVSVRNTNGSISSLFGISAFDSFIAGVDGVSDTQAGAHAYEFTQRIHLNSELRETPQGHYGVTSVRDVRDVAVDLPPGFVGSALATPTCTFAQLSGPGSCPPDTRVGHIQTEGQTGVDVEGPLFNIAPEHGVVAEFGYTDALKVSHVIYVSVVPSAGGYVLRAMSPEVPQVPLTNIVVTLYGNPAARNGTGNTPVAQFTNPGDCSGEALDTSIRMDSWQAPGRFDAYGTPDFTDPDWASASADSPAVTGCDLLQFGGSMLAQPETAVAATPTGLNVALKIPQNEDPGALTTPPLRKAVVTLPVGLSVNPSAADGLQTCSLAQIGLGNGGQPSCPDASKVASIELETPALAGVLQGSVYLAAQNENPFGTLLAGYIVVDDPTTGVLIKIPGRIDLDPVTGQLTATFDENPQFPFSSLKLHFFGGPRAPLTTPPGCGTYTTNAVLTPWSAPDSGPPATASDSFQISSGCGGGFNPAFSAGTTDNQAGGFSPFTATFTRGDQDQNLSGVTVKTPPGLVGDHQGRRTVPRTTSQPGHLRPRQPDRAHHRRRGHRTKPVLRAGRPGIPHWPLQRRPVRPVGCGARSRGAVQPRQRHRPCRDQRGSANRADHRHQRSVAEDPARHPLDVRTVNVTIDRSGFMFNPTSCQSLAVDGSLTSTQGAQASVSSRFQAANCANLPFKPRFTVSTQANTSKKKGASLDVKVGYPQGAQANIHSVAVTLPKQLPSRLSTIQQACPEATFNANPAACPAGSVIGTGTARTPVLANPVTGPAYLVSHGGAAFPDLVVILQGEGITLNLVGSINIKKQVTSSAFASVPDAPISSFELKLPEGPHSGLTAVVPAKAKGNLCGQALTMPTTLTGQNGAQIKQSTKITVTSCPKTKKKSKATKKKHGTTKKKR